MTHQRQIADDQKYCHFVTFSCEGRRKLLSADGPKRIVLSHLNSQLRRLNGVCVGFVLMPNHVHALIWFPEPEQLAPFIQNWKRLSSFYMRQWFQEQRPGYLEAANLQEHLWTPGFYSFEIYSERKLEEKLNYMHFNPVRAGLVEQPCDWRWSSARWYELGKSVGVPMQWVGDGYRHR